MAARISSSPVRSSMKRQNKRQNKSRFNPDQDVYATVADNNEAVRELLMKLKQAAKVPGQLERQVKGLEDSVSTLRRFRKNVSNNIASCESQLDKIQKRQEAIRAKMAPIESTRDSRKKDVARVRAALKEAEQQLNGFVTGTDKTIHKVRKDDALHRKKMVRSQLRSERGYSTTPSEQPYNRTFRTRSITAAAGASISSSGQPAFSPVRSGRAT